MNIIEKIVLINTTGFGYTLPVLEQLYGARCEIFAPLANPSHYKTSAKFLYNNTPGEVRQIVVANNYSEVETGGTVYYDPESAEPVYCWLQSGNPLIDNSKLRVHNGTGYQQYRVDTNSTQFNGVDGTPICIRYKLIPHV